MRSKLASILDDDPDTIASIALTLASEGYAVQIPVDATTARRMLGGVAPSLLFVDMRLAIANGPEITEVLRERAVNASVVVLSADPRAQFWASAIGAALCLRKPFRLEELLSAVACFRSQAARPAMVPVVVE